MAITTKPLRIPAKLLQENRELAGFIQAIIDRIEKPRVAAVANLGLTISNPPTQAEVQAVSNKVDALLAAMRTAVILEE